MEEISVFIDESGVIQKGELDAPDFFVIGMAFTSNEKLVKKVFTKRRLKQSSSRAFNFLIARYLSKYYKSRSKFYGAKQLSLFVDERNVATGAKFTLGEYLNTEYNIEDPICDGEIAVHYLDSKKRNLIQLADFLANTFYRAYKKNDPAAKANIEVLRPLLCNQKEFFFPLAHIRRIEEHSI